MPESPQGQKRLGRVILLWAGAAAALTLFFYGLMSGLKHPHDADVLKLIADGVIVLGMALMAIGVWRRRAKGS